MAVAVSKEKEFGEVYEVVRRPFVNSSDKSLKKTMVTLVNAKGLHHNIAFISYQFSEGEHPVDVKPHGNSKCNIPFFRTYQSTKTKLADQGTSAQPSRRFDRVFSDVGGLTQAEAVRQANYETRKDLFKAKDPIFEITSAIRGYNESAVAIYQGTAKEYTKWFVKDKFDANLTRLTTYEVNKNAGKKAPPRKRCRNKSPDATKQGTPTQIRLGEVLKKQSLGYAVASTPGNLKLVIKRKLPPKPRLTPTAHIPFELIDVSGNIKKCAGCYEDIRDGPKNERESLLDAQICIRHKENDYAPVYPKSTEPFWKPVFENRHYHVSNQCVKGRNPAFRGTEVEVSLKKCAIHADVKQFLSSRLDL
eukprot:Seg3549.1 transcript_id=Seg3549.1/GoldUCD/mRNA.D3Y31 product="hypothetical protein" protein_id=Seg3549.1/GoldUCD/D3Y31